VPEFSERVFHPEQAQHAWAVSSRSNGTEKVGFSGAEDGSSLSFRTAGAGIVGRTPSDGIVSRSVIKGGACSNSQAKSKEQRESSLSLSITCQV
jgi:hypothetical protein